MPKEGHENFPKWLKPKYIDIFIDCGYLDYKSLIKALEIHGPIYMSQIGGGIPQNVINDLAESDALKRRIVIRKLYPIQI